MKFWFHWIKPTAKVEKEEEKWYEISEKVLFYKDGDKTFFDPEMFPVDSISGGKTIRKEQTL